MRPNRLFVAGLILVVLGAVLPFLMVLGVLPSTLFLSFASYISSVTGLFLGILSAAAIYSTKRRKEDQDQGEGM
jgi:hypothetical protein